jgi:hypothetical protein
MNDGTQSINAMKLKNDQSCKRKLRNRDPTDPTTIRINYQNEIITISTWED